jgi:tetratricopeptide (TPR) repeat protein
MRWMSGYCPALLLFASLAGADEHHGHELSAEELGSIHFANSCAKAAQTEFNRAVALLHSFQYEQSRSSFVAVAERDPTCAMAQWGVAMSHYHGLWDNGDTAAGRAALQKAQQLAGANPKTTPRERAYIDALAEIYRQDDKNHASHDRAFEQKMGELQAAYPADSEAAIFHALTLAITAPKTDRTFANQRKCGEILEPIFKEQPRHPGIAHYIIHCYDNPVLAEQGLGAARMYARIAPASAHANHMPSHLFTRVGSWDESISSNLKSAQLAAAAEARSTNGEARDQRLHAMDYLEYAYLQSARVQQAKAVLEQMHSLPPLVGLTLTGDYAIAAIPARLAVELGNWTEASGLTVRREGSPWTQAITWTAIGVGAARSGNLERAAAAVQTLASLRDATATQDNVYWSNQIEVQRREVAGWIAQSSGNGTDAIAQLRSAAELEETMDKNAVTPGAVTPAREMLAQALFLQNHPQDALAEYQAVLKVAPNRFNALVGAANAAEAAGNAQTAYEFFRKLTQIAVGDERSELATARRKIAVSAQKAAR